MRCGFTLVEIMGTVLTMLIAESDSIKFFGGTSWFLLIQKASRSSFVSYLSVLLWNTMAMGWRKDALGCCFLNVLAIGGIGGIVLLNRLMKYRPDLLLRRSCRNLM